MMTTSNGKGQRGLEKREIDSSGGIWQRLLPALGGLGGGGGGRSLGKIRYRKRGGERCGEGDRPIETVRDIDRGKQTKRNVDKRGKLRETDRQKRGWGR